MTEIKVLNGGQYFNGKPIPEYRICIDGISINLPKERFEELTEKLGSKIKEDYKKMLEVDKKYENKIERLKEIKDKLLTILYGAEYKTDGWLIKGDPKEIDERISNLVEEYGKDLGLE